jgi:hypothetical protein
MSSVGPFNRASDDAAAKRAAWCWGFVAAASIGAVSACCSIPKCPPSSIVGVPAYDERLEAPLPLSVADSAKLSGLVTGCKNDGSSLCDRQPTKAQSCILTKLGGALPTTDSKAAAEALARCWEGNPIILEVWDARIPPRDAGAPDGAADAGAARSDGQKVVRGVAAGDWVFALYPFGSPPDYDGRPRVVVFRYYSPVPAP